MLKIIKRTMFFKIKSVSQVSWYPGMTKLVGKPDFMMTVSGNNILLPDKETSDYIINNKGTLVSDLKESQLSKNILKNENVLNDLKTVPFSKNISVPEGDVVNAHMIGTTHPLSKHNAFEVDPLTSGHRQFLSMNLFIDNIKNPLIIPGKVWKFDCEEDGIKYREYIFCEILKRRRLFQYWDPVEGCLKPISSEQIEKLVEINRLVKIAFPNVFSNDNQS